MKQHRYELALTWTGNQGSGTLDYRKYSRNHELSAPGKPILPGSSDPAFQGDAMRYNPEEMLVGSLSSCHMLWYLHLCAVNHVVVEEYQDNAWGLMQEHPDGAGEFTEVTLRPHVTVSAESDTAVAASLHEQAHKLCYIARSMNFPVKHEAVTVVRDPTD